jgi:hypothetical protein
MRQTQLMSTNNRSYPLCISCDDVPGDTGMARCVGWGDARTFALSE